MRHRADGHPERVLIPRSVSLHSHPQTLVHTPESSLEIGPAGGVDGGYGPGSRAIV